MSDPTQRRLLNSVYACLRPIARLLLRAGITYKQFAEASKRAFVEEAYSEVDSRGRRPNASRVAARIGLSRKEIRKLMELAESSLAGSADQATDRAGPLARVLHAWHTDPQFLSSVNEPVDLAVETEGPGPNFARLVRLVAGDLPVGAVKAELRRAGAIAELDDGRLVVLKRYYVPADVDERAVTVISGMLFPLAAGIEHNANPGRTTDGFIQRFAYADQLQEALVPVFRGWARQEATAFIERMDDWLSENEGSAKESEKIGAGRRVGVGVFYYEGPTAEAVLDSSSLDDNRPDVDICQNPTNNK